MKQTTFAPTKPFYKSKVNTVLSGIAILQLPEIQTFIQNIAGQNSVQIVTALTAVAGILARTFYTNSKLTMK